jgi:hypothetical protein
VLNFKWGLVAAIFAVLISVSLGIFSGVGFFHVLIRGFIFAIIFFGLGFGLRFIVNNFFPELLFSNDEAAQIEEPGSHINITIDSTGEYAVPELYRTADDSDELGNIEDLISGVFKPRGGEESPKKQTNGIDRKKEAGYNDAVGVIDFPEEMPEIGVSFGQSEPQEKLQFTPSFGDDSGLGGLPDLDMMARAFSSSYSGSPAPLPSAAPAPVVMPSAPSISPVSSMAPSAAFMPEDIEPERTRYVGNKPQAMQGDFDPKGLAEGIRTVLSKDK